MSDLGSATLDRERTINQGKILFIQKMIIVIGI